MPSASRSSATSSSAASTSFPAPSSAWSAATPSSNRARSKPLPRDQMIPKENLRIGDRVKAYLLKIDRQARGPQHPVAYRSGIRHQAVRTRSAGSTTASWKSRPRPATPACVPRSASSPNDPRIDPIGTCVGLRGARVQAVTNELAASVDIVLWSADPAPVCRWRTGTGRSVLDRRR